MSAAVGTESSGRAPVLGGRRILGSALVALRNRELARLLGSFGSWIAADWAYLIVLSVVAYDGGGPVAVGLIGAMRVLPAAVLGPAASLLTDRLSRPRILASAHASMCLITLALAWAVAANAPLAVVLVVVGVGAALSSVFKPCVNALLPQLVRDPRELVAANSVYSTVEAAATVAGPVLAGLLLAALAPAAIFPVLGALFAAAAVVSVRIRTEFQPARAPRLAGLGVLLEPFRGFSVLTGRPGVRVAVALFIAQTCMRGLLTVFVIVFAATGDGGLGAGALFAAMGIGGLIGALGVLGFGGSGQSARILGVGIALWGLPVLAIGIWPQSLVAWLALAVLGVGNAIEDVHGYTLLNRMLPDHLAGRAWGAFWSVAAAALALGSLTAPLLIGWLGLQPAMMITGAVLAACPLLAWPRLRAMDTGAGPPPEYVALLRQVPALAPMPVLAIQRLALSLGEVHLSDGDLAIRQGDIGDLFYVIADGCVTVTQEGRELRRLAQGDSFGEIALLLTVARTTTVTASGPCRLLTVDGDSFVAAVTGHRGAQQAADQTVRGYLPN